MALIKCVDCGTEISKSAVACPKCGKPNAKANHLSGGKVLGAFVLTGLMIWWLSADGPEKYASHELRKIENKVAADTLQEYQIAKRGGDPIKTCVHAGLVAAAYLQAKDETNYRQWLNTETADCKRAGIPK